MLFGGAGRHGTQTRGGGDDAETELALPLIDMHRGTTRTLTVHFGRSQKTIDVRIPPGARHDSRIRIPGGGPNGGDLYIRLKQDPDSAFKVTGDDTEVQVNISPWEAALGAAIQVPTLDGTSRYSHSARGNRRPEATASRTRPEHPRRGTWRSFCETQDRRSEKVVR
jgi:curved DNA-binding protein